MDWLNLDLSTGEWLSHGVLIALNVILFFAAGPLIERTQTDSDRTGRIPIARALNFFICVLIATHLILIGSNVELSQTIKGAAYTLMTAYVGLMVFHICAYFSRKRFGNKKELDKKIIYVETYSSRLVSLILLCVIGMVVLYTTIKIWGGESLLETTGIFGIIFAFLAFTSAHWAPDLLSGLVILNAQSLEDGDLVIIDGYDDEYIISKVSFIYSILFDIRNNNRTLIRNNRIMQGKIDNLSRIASTDGIRRGLSYKIGYPQIEGANSSERADALDAFNRRIADMFDAVFTMACEDEDIKINVNKNFEYALVNAGDYALEYRLWIYLDRLPATKVTATIRRHMLGTTYKVNELVYRSAVKNEIDLSTPNLNQLTWADQARNQPPATTNEMPLPNQS